MNITDLLFVLAHLLHLHPQDTTKKDDCQGGIEKIDLGWAGFA
ncbi:hypothetical protein YS40_096 [Thermus phage phiYS40]|nr:hypothetical protein YS40_096 [Thermus phage phiYS40]ABJ91490.1 hypothetical protein YS40_096 [Thermus phage phiYS40]